MLISVITINYNNEIGLLRTIESVRAQTLKEFEFIIIDGDSNDGSEKLIQENEDIITYACSEKDQGIYDAQNKGIRKAKGEYLIFMNSGDSFYESTVLEQFETLYQSHKNGIIYGNINAVNEASQYFQLQQEKLEDYYWYKHTLNHQATFIKKSLFEEFGYYRTDLKISSDYFFFLSVWVKRPLEFSHFNFTVCNFQLDGISQNEKNDIITRNERKQIQEQLFTEKQIKKIEKKDRKTWSLKHRFFHLLKSNFITRNLFQFTFFIYNKLK
jgi:glycosyltransferase involved in cell wall biosynthesis